MNLYRLTKLTAAAVLFLTLFNIHVKTMSVLCISDLGHLEFETAGSSCCTQDAATSWPVGSIFAHADKDCGSCVDVFFAQDIARIANGIQVASNNHAPTGPIPDAVFLSFALIGDKDSHNTIPRFEPVSSPVFTSRFSTVIRC